MITREITISNDTYNLILKCHQFLTDSIGPFPIATLDETLELLCNTWLGENE